MNIDTLCRLRQFFPLLDPYPLQGSFPLCMNHASQFFFLGGRWAFAHTALLNRVEPKAFRLINSLPLIDCSQSLKHRRSVAFLLYLLTLFSWLLFL